MTFDEFSQGLAGMDPAEVALGAGLVGIIGTLMVVGAAAWFFIAAIGYFKMFKKAGQRGWFAFIPILRDFSLFKMAWSVKAFIISTVLLVLLQICGESQNIIVSLVALACGIAWLVFQIKLVLRVVKAFGKKPIWALLLFFVPFITTMILGFGKAEYVGNPSVEKKVESNT